MGTIQEIVRILEADPTTDWSASMQVLPNGVKFVVTASDPRQVVKLKALGFMGIMVRGGHHQPHHLMIAKGQFIH